MAVHPPILFLGYAAFTIPFAAAIGNLLTHDKRWEPIATSWMRIAWLFLTLGIGLGGFWAYEVLGWGAWYWSWDPVETSSLIPWITSTAYLHAQLRYRHGEYGFVAPLLAIASFVLVIFAACYQKRHVDIGALMAGLHCRKRHNSSIFKRTDTIEYVPAYKEIFRRGTNVVRAGLVGSKGIY